MLRARCEATGIIYARLRWFERLAYAVTLPMTAPRHAPRRELLEQTQHAVLLLAALCELPLNRLETLEVLTVFRRVVGRGVRGVRRAAGRHVGARKLA